MAEIVLQGISKEFADGAIALQQTDLRIGDGEFFIIVGPSGCGKSTLLSIIVGLEEPSTGEVLIDGERVTDRDPKDRNMAMVFQSYALYPHMTVRENMAFPLRLAKVGEDEIEAAVLRVAGLLQIRDKLDSKPAELSGGERQRVAMGRAIVRRPAAFLLDEPLSNLDAGLRVQMRTELARLQKRLGTTTVYVTHDQTEAMTLGDRVAVLRQGQVQQVGSPRELYLHPANLFVAAFIGSPAMNLMPVQIEGDSLILPILELPMPEPFRESIGEAQGSLVAGIRPEHFYLATGESGTDVACFEATVVWVEWLGADLYVHFDAILPLESANELKQSLGNVANAGVATNDNNRTRLMARIDSSNRFAEGEVVRLGIEVDRICLFDKVTGKRIVGGGVQENAV